MNKEKMLSKYFSEIGKKGGSAGTGKNKIRGDSKYYRKLRAKRKEKKQ